MHDLILRWSIGRQDTTKLSSFDHNSKYQDLLWLAKLSVASFQRWFDARFLIFYNGDNFEEFKDDFSIIDFPLSKEVEFIDQLDLLNKKEFVNPYHFVPQGVWFKWIPFRYDINCHEISIDTDIICISKPLDWYSWLESDKELIVAPERYSQTGVNTCGDFWSHPLLEGKVPVNCGIVGHQKGVDTSDAFFQITREIKYGQTYNSLFITEQGAINLWVRSLALEGIDTHILDFERCAWVRDFLYYLIKGARVETVHATTWHKRIVKQLKKSFEHRVLGFCDNDKDFVAEILSEASEMTADRYILTKQIS